MSHNVRRGMKDGSEYQWMTNQGHHQQQQPQYHHPQQYSYGSNTHPVYPPAGSMGHHPYYSPPQAVYQYNDHQNGHHPPSWSNGSSVEHPHPIQSSYPSHPLSFQSPHHDPSQQQYLDMFSSPTEASYGYGNYQVTETFYDPSSQTKEDHSGDYSYGASDQDAVTSLEMGMTSLTVDTSVSDRALFSRDLEMYRKNQETNAANQGKDSSWASVAAGSKSKASLLKAKMMANAARSAAVHSYTNSVETSPNSSSWGESSKNGSSPKTPPTPPSASSSSIPTSVSHPLNPIQSVHHSNQEPPRSWNNVVKPGSQIGQQPSFQNQRQPPFTDQHKPYTNGRNQNRQDFQSQGSRQPERDRTQYPPRDDRPRTISTSSEKSIGNQQHPKSKEDEIRVEKILERPVMENRGRAVIARNPSSTSESEQSSSVQSSVPNHSVSSAPVVKAPLKPVIDPSLVLDKQQLEHIYNPKTFDLDPVNARFFVIKSYSEDDIHRSIKYSIWCSTEHGNKRLDTAFKNQEGKGPVYLFYSVNGSGHFCGIAQMMSPLDYHSSANVWAQDKWKGQFKVKWIYVKDVPNAQMRHIRLENNENKPVTNSRDTQEVFPEQGKQVLAIIHNYRHTTSIFDDYLHYEKRQEEVSKKNESDPTERTNDKSRDGCRGDKDDFRRNHHPNDRGYNRRDSPNRVYRDNSFHTNQQSSYNSSSNYRDNRNRNHASSSHFNRRRDEPHSWRE